MLTSLPSTMKDSTKASTSWKMLLKDVLKATGGGYTSLNHFLQVIATSFAASLNFLHAHKVNTRSIISNQRRACTYTIQFIILKILEYFRDIHHYDCLLFIHIWKTPTAIQIIRSILPPPCLVEEQWKLFGLSECGNHANEPHLKLLTNLFKKLHSLPLSWDGCWGSWCVVRSDSKLWFVLETASFLWLK